MNEYRHTLLLLLLQTIITSRVTNLHRDSAITFMSTQLNQIFSQSQQDEMYQVLLAVFMFKNEVFKL